MIAVGKKIDIIKLPKTNLYVSNLSEKLPKL